PSPPLRPPPPSPPLFPYTTLFRSLIYAVGGQGSIVVRPWPMGYVNLTIYALHAQPAQELDVVRQSIVNFFGPFLAAVPLAALLLYVREPVPFAALAANVVILAFHAVVELGDL